MEFQILLLIMIALVAAISFAYFLGKKTKDAEWNAMLPKIREDAAKRSRAVIGGQFSEQLAPFLPEFPYKPTEARFIGKPIDFIVFNGMDEKDINEVVFVEVKSGNANLSAHERKLRDAINSKKVRWEQYNIPKELTK